MQDLLPPCNLTFYFFIHGLNPEIKKSCLSLAGHKLFNFKVKEAVILHNNYNTYMINYVMISRYLELFSCDNRINLMLVSVKWLFQDHCTLTFMAQLLETRFVWFELLTKHFTNKEMMLAGELQSKSLQKMNLKTIVGFDRIQTQASQILVATWVLIGQCRGHACNWMV